jgi:NhaC family Na+:H+ antiporter
MVAALIALKNGHTWEEVQRAGQGALSSITTALICGVIAMSIGSSWTTAGTIGVGLVGVAVMLAAYLGDKLSPLSETTVLTAQMVEVDVHEHIKRQAWTSVPAFLIALVVFLVIGLVRGPEVHDAVATTVELTKLGDIYRITPLNLLPLLLLAVLSIRKLPPSLALVFAALFAGVLGAVLQPEVMRDFVGGSDYNPLVGSIKGIWLAMANGFTIDSGIGEIDRLLSGAAWTACCSRCG